ncbi:hypothetical protein [Helicobacter sp. 13S00477-4]|uniref:hypothetical protein n=1 Tax=Helicobacter sp. 13S00477-4 TaxID=1905759 RepID=UPI000BA7D7A5|nr:hypothetical protein [Helicobacter sp. 13S00477-4]PAF51269.1 hypothetical protein BKH44_06065 [Helicobacter sp. 13S00477-4]
MKKFLLKIHIYMSLFFVPLAIIYALTGIFYLFAYYGKDGRKSYDIPSEKRLSSQELADFTLKFLKQNNIVFRNMDVSFSRGGVQIGIMADFARAIQNANMVKIDVYRGDIVRYLMLLHFARGKWYFDALGVAFGVALFVFYLSGIFMSKHSSSKKRGLWVSFSIGLIFTVMVAYFNGM